MDALLRQGATAAYVADRLGEDLFTVVDVGCSGGHQPGSEGIFRAFGFDPQRYEIARLRAEESNPNVEHIEGYVGAPAGHPLRQLHACDVYWARSCWNRLAPARGQAVADGRTPPDFIRGEPFSEKAPVLDLPVEGFPRPLTRPEKPGGSGTDQGAGGDAVDVDPEDAQRQLRLQVANRRYDAALADATRQIVLPEFLEARGVSDVGFLKIDLDGPDYDILYTVRENLTELQVLGASLEVNFNGSHLPHHHTLHNTDRFMKAHGFALFALTVRNYSSAALAQPYEMPHPAQSIKGRPIQGDALYVRDFGLKNPAATPTRSPTRSWPRPRSCSPGSTCLPRSTCCVFANACRTCSTWIAPWISWRRRASATRGAIGPSPSTWPPLIAPPLLLQPTARAGLRPAYGNRGPSPRHGLRKGACGGGGPRACAGRSRRSQATLAGDAGAPRRGGDRVRQDLWP